MKKFLFMMLSIFSVNAFATKARVAALGNSLHLLDPQTIYKNSIDLIGLGNFVSYESGLTAATSKTNGAEAMVSYELDEKRQMAVSFGHQDEAVFDARNLINLLAGVSTFELPQNPLFVFYAVKDNITSYAFGSFYSNKNDKVAAFSEASGGISAAVEMGKLQMSTVYTFLNSVGVAGGKKFDGSGYWQSTISYILDDTTFELIYITSKARVSTEAGVVTTENELHVKDVLVLGLADSKVKDDEDFFWGGQVVTSLVRCKTNLSAVCDKSFTRTTLPVWFGIETQANDWLTIRGTVKQSFIINLTKDDFGYPAGAFAGAAGAVTELGAGENDTVISMGLGLKFNKLTIDGTLATSTTQKVDLNNFISQVGLTYNF